MAYLSNISPYKQRKKSLGELRESVEAGMADFKAFDFSVQNPYEDMTVNLQAAELQQQGLAQQQADILAGLRGAGGGAGAAALATGLSRQAAKSQQAITAQVGQQEQAIEQQKISTQFQLDQQLKEKEYGRMQTLLGMEMDQLAAAEAEKRRRDAAKARSTGALLGGVMGLAGTAIGAIAAPVGGAAVGAAIGGGIGQTLGGIFAPPEYQ